MLSNITTKHSRPQPPGQLPSTHNRLVQHQAWIVGLTTANAMIKQCGKWGNKNYLIWAASWQNQQCGCAPSEDSNQPGHPPSLIRVFAVRMRKTRVLSYPLSAQRRLWPDWVDAQADLSLRCAHTHFAGFVMRRLIYGVDSRIIWAEPLPSPCPRYSLIHKFVNKIDQ